MDDVTRIATYQLPKDAHLEVVLCELPHNEVTPFVTWLYNKQTQGYVWGHYFDDRMEALGDFNDRCKRGY